MLQASQGTFLLSLARETIHYALTNKKQLVSSFPDWVQEEKACFISLFHQEKLRGCAGSVFPYQSLLLDTKTNALRAARQDPRFPPIQVDELPDVILELSLLSPIQPLDTSTNEAALSQIQEEIHGVVLQWRNHKSVFLPQVWKTFPDKHQFVEALKKKAGLPLDFWAEDIILSLFTILKWSEK